jgi:beta-lactam-binding protein with PASTA domain
VPSVFDISALSDTVSLDDQGNGETTFTVSNHKDRARRGRAHVKVDAGGSAQANWFTVEDPEREFPIEGAKLVQQFAVKLKVPTDKPVKGSFKLVVASVRLPEVPDEHFTVGPPVGFEVKAVEPTVTKPFPWWILVVGLVALLLIGGLVTWLLWPASTIEVPDVVKQTRAEAERALEAEDLAVGTVTESSSTEKPGTVIATKPPAGAEVEAGSAVDLVISSSFVEVPSVVGQNVRAAIGVLKSKNLRGTITQRGDGPVGIVREQNPRAGIRVAPNDPVELIVPSVIPNLRGAPLVKALELLRMRGWRPGRVVDTNNNPIQLGRGQGPADFALVTDQQPAAGTPASPGQVIHLVVRLPQ